MAADTDRLIGFSGLSSWRGLFEFTLKNGLRVLFARRQKSPVADFRLVLDGGFAADSERHAGLAALAMAMFDEGIVGASDAQLGSALDALGALVHAYVTADGAVIGLSALNSNLGDALKAYANAIINLEFKTEDFELLRANRLAIIAAERLDPFQLALRVLPSMVYGQGHVYDRPFTGSGTERDVAAITCDDLRRYYASYLAPQSTTLVIAGPCETTELHSALEQTFGEWEGVPMVGIPTAATQTGKDGPSVVLVNRPGASQTVLAAGLPTFPGNSSEAEPLMLADTILAGKFTSRLNLSLRERKGWTYGVRSALLDTRMQGLWLIRTAVRTDCALQAMAEIASEIQNLAGRRPSTPDEFSRAVDYLVARIPSSLETCAQMADRLAHVIVHRLPVSYLQDLASRLRRLTPDQVTATCRQIVTAGGLRWMVVGDAHRLIEPLNSLAAGKIAVEDTNNL